MKKLVLGALVAVALLAQAPTAAAKEMKQATFCGAGGCKTYDDPDTLRTIPLGGEAMAPEPPAAPFYTVELVFAAEGEEHGYSVYWVPSEEVIGTGGQEVGTLAWFRVFGSAVAAMRRATDGIEPFAAPSGAWPATVRKPPWEPVPTAAPEAAPAAAPAEREGSATPWAAIASGAAGVLALVAAALVLRRRRAIAAVDQPTGA